MSEQTIKIKSKNVLHWFRNDLRVHDHPVLNAAQESRSFQAVFIIDPRQYAENEFGFPKTGHFRSRFLMETLRDLKLSITKLGSNLILLIGEPETIIPELLSKFDIDCLTYQKEDTFDEIEIENSITERVDIEIQTFESLSLLHIEDLPFEVENTPLVFTDFRKKIETAVEPRASLAIPAKLPYSQIDELDNHFPDIRLLNIDAIVPDKKDWYTLKGGENKALERLNYYIWDKQLISSYKQSRNNLFGKDYSSKFSPWLANGSLSPRKVYEEVKKYEQTVIKNEDTYWLIFELYWRDFFRFTAKKYGHKIFSVSGILDKEKEYRKDPFPEFEKWTKGETGQDFIDANMLELYYTGYMSNRGRQNVASYLCNDLNIDWRLGAAWFESKLIDYDVCSNYGNWMYIAGVGNDPRKDRYFNPEKQARMYDPKNTYTNYWLSHRKKILQLF